MYELKPIALILLGAWALHLGQSTPVGTASAILFFGSAISIFYMRLKHRGLI